MHSMVWVFGPEPERQLERFKWDDDGPEILVECHWCVSEETGKLWEGCPRCKGTGERMALDTRNMKRDWYVEGGRWPKPFMLKSGERVNRAYLREIDWVGIQREIEIEHLRVFEEYSSISDGEKGKTLFYWSQTPPKDAEEALALASMTPFAFISDEEWHEGAEGEWSEEKHADWVRTVKEFISKMPLDTHVVSYDLHD